MGNVKGFHGYAGFDGEDVVEGRDGSWYLGGRGNQMANYNHAVLLRSDTSGQVLWTRTLNALSFYTSLIALHDHTVLGLGSIGYSIDTGGFAMAIKYDTTGTQVWRRELFQTDDIDWPSQLSAGYEQPDSTLILAGWFRSITERDKGMLVKLNSTGLVLWQRLYTHYSGAAYGKDQIFWDVKPTSDGGMVLTGETNSDDYPYAQLWLLKLDSMGCLVPGCGSVGVQEYFDVLQPLLRVSPNPASDQVNLALDLPQGASIEGEVQVLLLDATGKLVLQKRVQQNFNQLRATMQVNALASGTYYLHLRDGKRWLAGSKLVVE